jgi:hypothetical protein
VLAVQVTEPAQRQVLEAALVLQVLPLALRHSEAEAAEVTVQTEIATARLLAGQVAVQQMVSREKVEQPDKATLVAMVLVLQLIMAVEEAVLAAQVFLGLALIMLTVAQVQLG